LDVCEKLSKPPKEDFVLSSSLWANTTIIAVNLFKPRGGMEKSSMVSFAISLRRSLSPGVQAGEKALYITMCTIYNMMVKDAMVLIHLAKLTLLEKNCEAFGKVMIPELVYKEAVGKKGKGTEDSLLIESLIRKGRIEVKKARESLVKRLAEMNIQGGEAESIALYWEAEADFIASDDSNVIRKRDILGISLIGTPAIVLHLYRQNLIDREKVRMSVRRLREIGWFSGTVLDKILLEAEHG